NNHEAALASETYGHLNAAEETWTFSLDLAESDRVYDLKAALLSLTNVPPERQKILGLVKGKLPPDEGKNVHLKIAPGKNFILVGTPAGDEIKDPSQTFRKIREATSNLQINIINPLREGKRLLVLDLDYTIVDTKPLTSGSLPPVECARPGLHEFLEAWLEAKLVELGMVGSTRAYEVILDKTCMFTVFSERNGKPYSHHVKPLQIIWNKFPQFSAKNTVHVDDLQAQADRELEKLARYMVYIASLDDFRTVKHKVMSRQCQEWQFVV
ncbi:hypothetical protein BKA83DRAFT_4162668, partial [Pisolithus microcarpus]